jgi:hypothetical protein
MARQQRTTTDLAAVLGLQARAAQRRYSGEVEFSLDEVADVAAWLEISSRQLLTGVREAVA